MKKIVKNIVSSLLVVILIAYTSGVQVNHRICLLKKIHITSFFSNAGCEYANNSSSNKEVTNQKNSNINLSGNQCYDDALNEENDSNFYGESPLNNETHKNTNCCSDDVSPLKSKSPIITNHYSCCKDFVQYFSLNENLFIQQKSIDYLKIHKVFANSSDFINKNLEYYHKFQNKEILKVQIKKPVEFIISYIQSISNPDNSDEDSHRKA
ncbi:MAG: hypothetical protein HW421_94 [Ignavibacteria bacterium]|nr:hypothetical protein [Ignavibacteria bacterium]